MHTYFQQKFVVSRDGSNFIATVCHIRVISLFLCQRRPLKMLIIVSWELIKQTEVQRQTTSFKPYALNA
uniref:Uncharacterized protein n=1 Tax=Arion vulgaris TaxID=1028688 RepID=A0A0B6ZG39_9EUPU